MTVFGMSARQSARQDFVARGRAKLLVALPDAHYDAHVWETAALAEASAQLTPRLYFTLHASETVALPPEYATVVKAWVITAGGTPSRMSQRVFAARWLWKGIAQRLGSHAMTAFTWDDIRDDDLRVTEQLMIAAPLSLKTIYRAINTLNDLCRIMSEHGVAPSVLYTPTTKRQADSNNHRVDDLEARPEGVLTDAAQDALADLFHRAQEPRDVIWTSFLALLVATGIRFNEGMAVPLDCLVVEPVRLRTVTDGWVTRHITYLRYWKSKSQRGGGGGKKVFERVPLTESQAELARLAVQRLTDALAASRVVAARLESTAPRWVAPTNGLQWYRKADLTDVLGWGEDSAGDLLREQGGSDPDYTGSGRPTRRIARSALEAYMTTRQDWDQLWAIRPARSHAGQRMSQTLMCVRANELHGIKGTMPLIDPPSHSSMEAWLEGRGELSVSVFTRFEQTYGVQYREPDGTPAGINSHECRRLFVSTARAAGATIVDVARWQGREHIGDLRAYDKRSLAEKVRATKAAIINGRLRGPVAQAFVQMAKDVRDEWLEGQVQAMHITPYGLCIHDFSAAPCELAINCVKHCKDFLHDPNNPEERRELVQLQRRTKEALASSVANAAPSWIAEQRETLAGLERILTTVPAADGGYVAVFVDANAAPTLPEPTHGTTAV